MYKLDTNIQSATVYLDSTNCVTRSPYFQYDLASSVSCPTGVKMLLSVAQVSLPNVINNVTEYNNIFSVQTNHSPTLTNFTITIPIGIYSAWSFRDYLNSQFIARSIPVNCIYSNYSFKYTFVSSYDFNIKNTTTNPTTCGYLIGVAKSSNNQYIFPIQAGSPYFSIEMPSTVNFSSTPYVFLKISNISLSNINSRGNINDSLLRFPVNCEAGQMIQYRPTELNKFLLPSSNINTVRLHLEDVYNHPLAIPSGVELQVVLKIDYIYPAPDQDYGVGTIPYFYKSQPITVLEQDLEED